MSNVKMLKYLIVQNSRDERWKAKNTRLFSAIAIIFFVCERNKSIDITVINNIQYIYFKIKQSKV